jgi:hypothetical protein
VGLPPADREPAEAGVVVEAEDVLAVERRRGALVDEALEADLELAGLGEAVRRRIVRPSSPRYRDIGRHQRLGARLIDASAPGSTEASGDIYSPRSRALG